MSFNFMAAVTICNDFGAQKYNVSHCFHCFPIYLPWSDGKTHWFQIGKGLCQGYILSPCLFNFYAEYIMRNAGLEEAQAGIKIAGRNINNRWHHRHGRKWGRTKVPLDEHERGEWKNWLNYEQCYISVRKEWGQEEKGVTEDEAVGWTSHRLNGHEFEQTLGDSEGQGSLVCCGPWGRKELDRT